MNSALRAVLSGALVVGAGSCQTYDFEPVTPLAIAQTTQPYTITAQRLKPNLMLLIDKSSSMAAGEISSQPVSGSNPAKITTLKSVMNTFLSMQGHVARMGVTIYPKDDVCAPSTATEVLNPIRVASDSDTDLQAQADAVNANVQAISLAGGTPTSLSLSFVGTLSELNDPLREDFVLLLTDGLPNCNPNNQNTCANPATCRCTVVDSQGMAACAPAANDARFCVRGCLDTDGSVQAIRDLRTRGIRTIVIGFGSDVAGSVAGDTLNAMALAGGFNRTCPNGTDAECGSNNTCLTNAGNVCERGFYQAANGAELAAALAQISENLAGDSICRYMLSATPSSSDLISVIVDGVPQQRGQPDTWELMSGAIVMQGALCDKLKASTTQNPVELEIRIVQAL